MLLVVLGGCAAQPAVRLPRPGDAVLAEVSAIVTAGIAEQQVPGASLVVMKGDDVLLSRGFGVESIERADPVAPATVFEFGSISKQFTAALILKLAEEGKLSVDDPVARRLPDFTHLPSGLGNGEFVREGQPYGYRLYFGSDGASREVRILGMGMMNWYGRRRPQ